MSPQKIDTEKLVRYEQLLLEIVQLEEQYKGAKTAAEIVALTLKISLLWNEAMELQSSGGLPEADILAAHAKNQKVWTDAPTESADYGTIHAFPAPNDAELKSRGFKVGDGLFVHADGRWQVLQPRNLSNPGFNFVREIA